MAKGMHYEEKLVTLVAIIAFFMVTNITRKRFNVKFMRKLAVLIFGGRMFGGCFSNFL